KAISGKSDAEIAQTVKDYLYSEIPPGDRTFSKITQNDAKIVLIPEVTGTKKIFTLDSTSQITPVLWPAKNFLQNNLKNIGLNEAYQELDLSIRKVPLLYFIDGQKYLGFSLRNVVNKLGLKDDEVEIDRQSKALKLRDKKVPLDDTYQLLVNYAKKPFFTLKEGVLNDKIKLISFVDVYNNRFPEGFDTEILKDNIVLVGAYSSYTNDKYRVPISTELMYGVMIHASSIQTILDQAWLREMSIFEQILTLLFLAILASTVIYSQMKIRYSLPILAGLLALYWLVIAPLAFDNGLILNMVYPPLAVVLATIVGYAYRYVTEFKAKNMAAGALTKYVNADVAEQVIEGDLVKTGGERREITVIFTDIKGFTSISEGLSPQKLVRLLNEYFSVMTAVIVRCGGIVDKFEGDAIMAFFEGDNHAQKAAAATLEMRKELIKWKEESLRKTEMDATAEKWPDIEFRAGVSTGQAVVGNIGSSDHLQYTAIGDIVNLGSRLESANKFYQTKAMVAEATFEQIKDSFECRFLDVIQVKGKEIPVKIYELIAHKGDLANEQIELIAAYNQALGMYFQRDFVGAAKHLKEQVLVKWPGDYLAQMYAERAELFSKNPPTADWNFVHKMESK
ncbi:adenylate/guanylate cyclase domain-containing protein, partial [Candidatus Peregrinibacteria bacterium]|nr:adenylate/guanylate cyclase domain-containing protein [Candidatus Peregrinibacteria bacterium]